MSINRSIKPLLKLQDLKVRNMTQNAAARLLKMAPRRCWTFRIGLSTWNGRDTKSGSSVGSALTKSDRKGRKYATTVYDLKSSRVVRVGKGKGRETSERSRGEEPSVYWRLEIGTGCYDTRETYIGAIGEWCPNATLTPDRFQVVKALNDAVGEVRREQRRSADDSGHPWTI